MAHNEDERKRWNDEYWTSAWPRRELLTSAVTDYVVDALGPAPGERILDVGTGAGPAALTLAGRVGVGAVVGADLSVPLVGLAAARASERGLTNATFVVADLQYDEVPGAPFDAAVSQFGVMFFDEPVRAFANIRRQVTPDGRLVFACWRAPELNPWLVAGAMAPFIEPRPAPESDAAPPGPFALADADATGEILLAAGWVDVTVVPHDATVVIDRDVLVDDAYLEFWGVAAADRAAAWTAIDAQLAPLARPDGRLDAPLAFQVFSARNEAG